MDLVMMALHPTDRNILTTMAVKTVSMTTETIAMIVEIVAVTAETIAMTAGTDSVMIGADMIVLNIMVNMVITPLVVQQRDIRREKEDTDLHRLVLIGVTVVSTLEVLTNTVSILEGKIHQGVVTGGIQAARSVAVTVLRAAAAAAAGIVRRQDTKVARSHKEERKKVVRPPLKQNQ